MFKLAASLRGRGLSEAAILSALLVENEARNKPPLEHREIQMIARSAGRYEQGEVKPDPATSVDAVVATLQVAYERLTPDDAFTQEIVGCLALLYDNDPAEYSAWRKRLQTEKKVGVRDLDRAVKKKRSDLRELRLSREDNEPWILAQKLISDFPEPDIKIPCNGYDWRWTVNGIQEIVDTPKGAQTVMITGTPAAITRTFRSVETGEQKVELTYRVKNAWKHMVVERFSIADARSIVRLVGQSFDANSETGRGLVRFFAQQMRINSDTLPEVLTTSKLGWSDNTYSYFVPHSSGNLHYETDEDDTTLSAFHASGALNEWIETIGNVARLFSLPRLLMAASLAAPMLRILGLRTFFVHIYGRSGGGKSAAVYAAASVWGDPERMKATFGGTRVGLENAAALFNDLPLIIDEKQVAGERRDHIRSLVYMITLEKSKARGTRSGGMAKSKTWRTLALTTGEHPLTDDSMEAGVKNRMLELAGVPFEDDEDTIISIYENTAQYHGTAGLKYIEHVIHADHPDLVKKYKAFIEVLAAEAQDIQTVHISMVAGLVLCDYLSSIWLYDQTEEEAYEGALELGRFALQGTESKNQISDSRRAMDYLQSYVDSHRDFFDNTTSVHGVTSRYFLGSDLHIYPDRFKAIMTEGGFNPDRILRDWADEGWIETEKAGSGNRTFYKSHRFNGAKKRVVVLKEYDGI